MRKINQNTFRQYCKLAAINVFVAVFLFSIEIPALAAQTENYVETVNGVSFAMVHVKGGEFTMGRKETDWWSYFSMEETVSYQKVQLGDFHIGETEVTQALWIAVMENNPSNFVGCDECPVEQVSWLEAQEFVQKLNVLTGKLYRLPSEAEWEYAATGGHRSLNYRYSGSNSLGVVGWFSSNSNDETHPVKGKKNNELGLYDMSGNVFEWCQDWKGNYIEGKTTITNPQGPSFGNERIARGGAYSSFDFLFEHQPDARRSFSPTTKSPSIGLRLAID